MFRERILELLLVVSVVVDSLRGFLMIVDDVGHLIDKCLDGLAPGLVQTDSRELLFQRRGAHTSLRATIKMIAQVRVDSLSIPEVCVLRVGVLA